MEQTGLKVLMISSDRKVLEAGSAVAERMKEYGKLVLELHIILLSDASHRLKETKLDANVWVYPTNSITPFLRPLSARSLGSKIVASKGFVRGRSVITADSIECGWAGIGIKRRFRLPLEVQFHSDPFSPFFSGFQNAVRKFFASSVIENADSVRVVSASVGEEIIRQFLQHTNSLVVLPIYIDRERIEKGQVQFDLHGRFGWHAVLLCVARLTPEKNLGMALEVLKRVRGFFPDTGLVIVGSGPEENRLKALASKLGVASNVAFAGWQEDMASYYHTATIFIQTSYFEGYGLALVEAGLSGLPVVTTPVGIANDLESGVDLDVCPQNDPEFMFKAVYDLIQSEQKRDQMKSAMKRALESKLISKEEYLRRLKESWQETSLHIHA